MLALLPGCGVSEEKPPVKPEPEQKRLFKLPELKEKGSAKMTRKLDAELLREIDWHVRAGFYDKSDLMRIICEEIYAQEDIDEALVSATIDSQLAALEEKKKTWPAVTDCDRLDSVFAALNKRGIIALQNAGNTQSDGYEDFRYDYEEHPDSASVVGYCFYHKQDLELVVSDGLLYLAFGPVDPKEEEAKGLEVGNMVREELQKAGLKVEWDGTFNERLKVQNFVWQRR
ncbi:hypothetical protein [uncultured Gimesia sp.]|uniref:DUF6891 domain-containing protein n=1 Tax=uncultured Gimesia sp. TaxID=1678688 RepID=UPI0030D6D8F7